MNKEITKETTFAELIEESPEFVEMLEERGMGCAGCPMAQFDTIENGSFIHGRNPDELIKELNEKRNNRTDTSKKITQSRSVEVEWVKHEEEKLTDEKEMMRRQRLEQIKTEKSK